MMIRYKFLYVFLNLLALWSLKNVAVVATSTDSVPEIVSAVNGSETLPWGLTLAPAIATSEELAHLPFISQAASQTNPKHKANPKPIGSPDLHTAPTAKLTPISETSSNSLPGNSSKINPAPKPPQISTQARDLLASRAVLAQNPSSENAEPPATLRDLQPLVIPVAELPRAPFAPGISFGTPSGFGADRQTAFVGFSYGTRGRDVKDDGSIVVGAGFGDAVESIGFETTVAIISLADSFADSGTVGFKLHKTLPGSRTGIAIGWADAIKWGDASREKNTIYGVVTQGFTLPVDEQYSVPIALTLGVGTGQFRSNGAQKAGENVPNLFASVGARVSPEISLLTTWTGAELNIGVGVAPFRTLPLTFTLGVGDITGATTTGTRFLFNAGYVISF